MTVDGFAYHYCHPHHHHPHHHHPHPHQSPSAPTGNLPFFPFSFFHSPSSFFLYLFFHLGELGQPNHVQFRVTGTVMTVIFYFFLHLPSRCPGQRQNEKSFTSGKEKSQNFVQFPVVIHHIYTGGNVNREKRILRSRSWLVFGWVVELVLFILCFFLLALCILFWHFHR